MALRYDEVADIIRIIDASSCDELVLETGDLKLVVRRRGAGGAAPATAAPSGPGPIAAAASSASASAGSASENRAPGRAKSAADAVGAAIPAGFVVRAPMVGTFYRAPSPEAPPFVEIGSEVEAGQPLCVIEVMKLFTTVYAERAGRIVHVGAENAEAVEYGRILFVIEERA